jgi:sugar lactone lactonase YvrE
MTWWLIKKAGPIWETIEPSGTLAGRRVWAQFDELGYESPDIDPSFPDGICLDAEGAIWVALPWGQTEVPRVLEGGEVTPRVKVETRPFAAMLVYCFKNSFVFVLRRLSPAEYGF